MRGARRTLDPSTGLYTGDGLNRQSSGQDRDERLDRQQNTGLDRSERLDASVALTQQSSAGCLPQYPLGSSAQGAVAQNITVRLLPAAL